jgi:hypothetical protein
VDMDRIRDDVVAEIVGFAISATGFHAPARHPRSEAAGMMIAAVLSGCEFSLAIDSAAEFDLPRPPAYISEDHAASNPGSTRLQGWSIVWHCFRSASGSLEWCPSRDGTIGRSARHVRKGANTPGKILPMYSDNELAS